MKEFKKTGLTLRIIEINNFIIAEIYDNENNLIARINEHNKLDVYNSNYRFLKKIVNDVYEYCSNFNGGFQMSIQGMDDYRILSEYNNYILSARETENGMEFSIWYKDIETGELELEGHYMNFDESKSDFAKLSGLSNPVRFSETELKIIHSNLVAISDMPEQIITPEDEETIYQILDKIELTVKILNEREKFENEQELEQELVI
jgi:hypothetical protein